MAGSLTPGCFRYAAVDVGGVDPQQDVRVRITDDAAVRLALRYGSIAQTLDGTLSPFAPDSLLLSIWVGRDYIGTSFQNARQRIALHRGDVLGVSRRQFARGRTALAAAGVLAVVAIVIDGLGFIENPNPLPGGGNADPPDPDAFLPAR